MRTTTNHKHTEPEVIEYTVARYTTAGKDSGLLTNQAWKVDLEGCLTLTAVKRSYGNGGKTYYSPSRVYGVLDILVPDLKALEPFKDESIPLHPEQADDKVKAAMWTAWRNATTRRGKELLVPLLHAVAEPLGLQVACIGEPKFSAYAGCKCPCSPGYIMAASWDRCDLWLTRTETDS